MEDEQRRSNRQKRNRRKKRIEVEGTSCGIKSINKLQNKIMDKNLPLARVLQKLMMGVPGLVLKLATIEVELSVLELKPVQQPLKTKIGNI